MRLRQETEVVARAAASVAEVVSSGLCIGCGLCEAVTAGRVRMAMTDAGSLRPRPADGFSEQEERQILSACPGTTAQARALTDAYLDPIWGAHSDMRYAWAGNPDVRFEAATGGVLTALGMHLLDSGQAAFVLHVAADPDQPMRSTWVMSDTPEQVRARAGSRYGPTAPLAGLLVALERSQPFAIIAKPCDLGAVHALSRSDPRIDALCVARMAMVCGGQSRLRKSQRLLEEFNLSEQDVSLFRYRGHGNPGLTTVETKAGQRIQKTYQELWEDESAWELETRCKLCPDALGEAADLAAADVWPGGGPTGEDVGFNGIVIRSPAGQTLVQAAVSTGHLTLGDPISPDMFNDFQPHQLRKKYAIDARLEGLEEAGLPRIATDGLRLAALGDRLPSKERARQKHGNPSALRGRTHRRETLGRARAIAGCTSSGEQRNYGE